MTRYGYCIANPSTQIDGTGTISVSSLETAVLGVSTLFTTELAVGDVLVFSGNVCAVATISDNTHLTLSTSTVFSASSATFKIVKMVNVESLTTPVTPPKSTYRNYTDSIKLANGKLRGLGRPIASWRWGFITLAQRTQLRTFCNRIKSNVIYIRTRTNEADAYQTFSVTIVWPDDEDKQAGRRVNFTLEFKNLVQL